MNPQPAVVRMPLQVLDAFTTGTASAGSDSGEAIAGVLERLEETPAEQEAELRRKRTAVQRMRAEGSRMGLLSDIVTERLKSLPEGSLRQADLDSLLVTERIFGPLGAAVHATRFSSWPRIPACGRIPTASMTPSRHSMTVSPSTGHP